MIKAANLRALVDDNSGAISLKSIVSMDNEPMHFLQAFHGSLVVRTNDYLKHPEDDTGTKSNVNYIMMF
jgi:hypothetical protein